MIVDYPSGAGQLRAGKIRPLAVCSADAAAHRCPTCRRCRRRLGLAGFEAYAWQGLVVPAAHAGPDRRATVGGARGRDRRARVDARMREIGLEPLEGGPDGDAGPDRGRACGLGAADPASWASRWTDRRRAACWRPAHTRRHRSDPRSGGGTGWQALTTSLGTASTSLWWPGLRCSAIGRQSRSAVSWRLVLRPPRDTPMA